MESHRIALISDTHGILRKEVEERLKTCEIILHAGDIGKPEILSRLRGIADTYAVRGNVDADWKDRGMEILPEELDVQIFGFHIYMVHNKKHIRKDLHGVDIVVYGHSHILSDDIRCNYGEIRYLNPGSCGPKRFRLPVTMMIVELYPSGHHLEVEKIDCLSPVSEKEEAARMPEKDIYRLVREIMKEVDAGKNIADIASRNRIDIKFTEQVCRMYLTHSGVDVDGILDRIERKNL